MATENNLKAQTSHTTSRCDLGSSTLTCHQLSRDKTWRAPHRHFLADFTYWDGLLEQQDKGRERAQNTFPVIYIVNLQ